MTKSDVDRFVSEAEDCVRQAEIANNPLDKIAWLQLAEDWIKLAGAIRERDV